MSGIRGMVQQHDFFTNLLRITDHMKAFISERMSAEEELEQAEASLSATRKTSEESAKALKRS